MKQGNRYINKPLGKLTTLLAITFIFLLLLILSLPFLGNFLVAEDEPQKADIIIVLMGSGPDRMLGAVVDLKNPIRSKFFTIGPNIWL